MMQNQVKHRNQRKFRWKKDKMVSIMVGRDLGSSSRCPMCQAALLFFFWGPVADISQLRTLIIQLFIQSIKFW